MRAFEPVPRQSIVCLDDVAAQYKLAGETTDASNARRLERAVSGRARNTPETALQRPPRARSRTSAPPIWPRGCVKRDRVMGAQPSVELAELDPGDEGVTLPTD